MDRIKIKLREDVKIAQPMAQPWTYGEIAGFVRAADDRPYAVILTEKGEFELCLVYQIMQVIEK